MICPNCGTENANNLAACENCGVSFESIESVSSATEPSFVKKYGKPFFTRVLAYLIIGFIVLVAVGNFKVYSYRHSRIGSSQNAAMATCKDFSTAAIDFESCLEHQGYWEDGTTDFDIYFGHVSIKSGYNFKYFSDDRDGDGIHEATKFIYFAVPVAYTTGKKSFFFDETDHLFAADVNEQDIKMLNSVKSDDIDWKANGADRLNKPEVVFTER